MKSRISITLDPAVHRKARKVASARGTSVSGLIESLLRRQEESTRPVADALVGTASLREVRPGADARFDHLKSKYLHG